MPRRVFLFTRQLRLFQSSILRRALGLLTAGLLGRVLTKYLDVLFSQKLRPSDIHHQPAWGQGRGTSTLAWHCTAVSLARRTHCCIPASNAFGSIDGSRSFPVLSSQQPSMQWTLYRANGRKTSASVTAPCETSSASDSATTTMALCIP
ncbi:hypothetical protein CGRA01v4_02362 [Colletotrichum graminicola]|nr:hypothetical protein CGRA01v4_02362 [Colletotrichum graminicola]